MTKKFSKLCHLFLNSYCVDMTNWHSTIFGNHQ